MAEIINLQDVPTAQAETPKFDPNKKYTWTPNDTFILSGGEFGVILNALRATVGTQEAARILLAKEAHEIIEGTLASAVESGVVKEATDTPKSSL
jgi:hypothetical protein